MNVRQLLLVVAMPLRGRASTGAPRWLTWLLAALLLAPAASARPSPPQPPLPLAKVVLQGLRDDPRMVFGHYTFAVMWLPGLCQTWSDIAAVCAAPQNRAAMHRFTLHGLWPSRPRELIEQGVPAPQWWRTGCYRYSHGNESPPACSLPPLDLPAPLQRRLQADMPLTATCLDRHEYSKHIACFGPQPVPFFTAALDLLDAVNRSAFAHWVADHAGQRVQREAIERAYARAFGLPDARSLQLECEARPGSHRRDVLTQAWITLATDRLAEFPAPAAFAPGLRGNCAAKVWIAAAPAVASHAAPR